MIFPGEILNRESYRTQEDKGSDLPARPDKNNALVYVVRPSGWLKRIESKVFLDSKEDSAEMGFNEGSQYIFFYGIRTQGNIKYFMTRADIARSELG